MVALSAILDRIRVRPDDEAGWRALANHLDDDGCYALSLAVRYHWPAIREELRNGSLIEDALRAFSPQDAAHIARQAREAEERRLLGPE